MSTIEAPPRHYTSQGGAALAVPVRPAPRPARRRPEAPPRRHLRVVGPTDRVRRRLTPRAGVVLTGLTFVTLLLVAVAHTLLVQGQIRLDDLDAQLRVEQARYQELRKEVAESESPARVVAAAEDLGMVMPEDLVYLQPPATTGAYEPAPPAAVDGDASTAPQSTWSTMKPLLDALAP